MPCRPSRFRRLALVAGALLVPVAVPAQVVGLPVLQTPFVFPGRAAGVNVGVGDDLSAYAAAASWAPGTAGRVQLSVGLGAADPDEGDAGFTYGGRLGFRVPTPWTGTPQSRLGLSAFAGVGGLQRDDLTFLHVPAGVSVGWRTGIGPSRALSLYASPFYSWNRVSDDTDEARSQGLFRVALGVDLTLFRRMGVSLGYELGQTAENGEPGASGGVLGAGLAYAF